MTILGFACALTEVLIEYWGIVKINVDDALVLHKDLCDSISQQIEAPKRGVSWHDIVENSSLTVLADTRHLGDTWR